MKRALITGITGQVRIMSVHITIIAQRCLDETALLTLHQDGSYLAEFLLEKGYEVHGIIRRSSSFNTNRIEHLYKDRHEGEDYRDEVVVVLPARRRLGLDGSQLLQLTFGHRHRVLKHIPRDFLAARGSCEPP